MAIRSLGLCALRRTLGVSAHCRRCLHRLLGQSTILVQDGLHIEELPLVLKRATVADLVRTNDRTRESTVPSDSRQLASHEDEMFRLRLCDCTNIHQVFRQLEVPAGSNGGRLSAAAAVFALERLAKLRRHAPPNSPVTLDRPSFVRTAVLNELCETATRDVRSLECDALVSLAIGHLVTGAYDARYVSRINDEVALRVGDGAFSIAQLCSLLQVHSESTHADPELTQALWAHLGTRSADIDHTSLGAVYRTLRYTSPQQVALRRLCERRLQSCWGRLTADDVCTVARTIALTALGDRLPAGATAAALSKWLALHLHSVGDRVLKDLLSAYTRLGYSDALFVQSLERYVTSKVSQMDKTLIAMVMEHCRNLRYLSPRIFDAVAADFRDNGLSYPAHAMVYTLRPFGELNYLPGFGGAALFRAVEEVLRRRLPDLKAPALLQLLASFVYIERFPVNFISQVFSTPFIAQILGIAAGSIQQEAARNLMQLQAAMMIEFPRHLTGCVDRHSLGVSPAWLEGRHFKFHQNLGRALQRLVGSNKIRENVIPRSTPYLIDYLLQVTSSGQCLSADYHDDASETRKLALVGVMPEHICVNTGHLLGEFAMKKRHLSKLGYHVIDVDYQEFSWSDQNRPKGEEYLRLLLTPHATLMPAF